MIPGLLQGPAAGSSAEVRDTDPRVYTLLKSLNQGALPEPLETPLPEVGALSLVPVVVWCLVSWGMSYAGFVHQLAKFQLFAFIPAAASAFAFAQMRKLRVLPAQLTCLQEENEWFKNSNANLKEGVDLLRAENEEAKMANKRLQNSIWGLESVRSAMETYATKHETDFGQVLADFQKSVQQQAFIMHETRQIQRETRKLTEAQWRALMLNLFAQVEFQDGESGMSRDEYNLWLSMLPTEIADKLSPETFESIDSNGDDIIDAKEMCDWVKTAVKTILTIGDSDEDSELAAGSEAGRDACTSTAYRDASLHSTKGGRAVTGATPTPPARSAGAGSPTRLPATRPPTGGVASPRLDERWPWRSCGPAAGGEPQPRGASAGGGANPAGAAAPRSTREVSVCCRSSTDGRRPSFNDGYIQMLFGSGSSPSRQLKRTSTSSPAPTSSTTAPSTRSHSLHTDPELGRF